MNAVILQSKIKIFYEQNKTKRKTISTPESFSIWLNEILQARFWGEMQKLHMVGVKVYQDVP